MGKKDKQCLGRALIKDRFTKNRNKKHVEDNSMLHTTEVNDGYDWGRLNLQSVTAESSLQEFLSTAELAEKEFTAEKLNIHYVKSAPSEVQVVTSQPDFSEPLTVPRRPQWMPGVGAEEQAAKEKESYLEWRKNLNELQAKLGAALTPYERNLELWKQLWRTLERSDLVLLLLDARNPLLFRCADLEKFAAEQKCKCILLLNKADLITEYERKCWAEHFDEEGIQVIFFSAVKSEKQMRIDEENQKEESQIEDSESEEDHIEEAEEVQQISTESTEKDIELFKRQVEQLDHAVSITANKLDRIQDALTKVLENIKLGIPTEPVDFSNKSESTANDESTEEKGKIQSSHRIVDRNELLAILKGNRTQLKLKNHPHLTVGMIGYPNVGKSSTVNVLMETKKVSVSAMPGHTRHIQSLVLDEELHILDCPGLVLPAYAVAPDLLLTAVLPIDQMKSHDAAVCRVCEMLPKRTVERKYGLLLPLNEADPHTLNYKEVLTAHAYNRGFMTAGGQPDVSRSARLILKDAASGRLHWAVLPPGCAAERLEEPAAAVGDRRKPTPMEARMVEGWSNKSDEIDKSFFGLGKGLAHVKGKPIPGLSGVTIAPTQDVASKPWKQEKKHANKNKREKLRRVYRHLDEH